MWSDFLSIQRSPATQNLKKASAQSSQGQFRTSGVASATFGRQMLELQETVTQYANRRSQDVVQIQARVPGNQYAANPPESPSSSGVSASTEAKLAELREIAKNADYTGMSYSEIYKTIYDRYNEASGGKLKASAFFNPPGDSDIIAIKNQLDQELKLHIYTPLEKELEQELGFSKQENRAEFQNHFIERRNAIYAEALGYGGMNYDEIEKAIVEKYKEKDSLQDFLEMQGELNKTGVLLHKLGGVDRLGEYYSSLNMQINLTYFRDTYVFEHPLEPGQYEATLLKHFEPVSFFSDLKRTILSTTYTHYDRGYDVKNQVLQDVDWMMSLFQK